jgi:hypothetical protein
VFKRVEIDESDIEWAKMESGSIENLNNSIRSGKGSIYGKLGERIFHKTYPEASYVNNYDYDFCLKSKTFDIKTKCRNVPPLENYEAIVPDMNTSQKCDFYFFVQVQNDMTHGWLLGYKSKEFFYKQAKLMRKGTNNGWSEYKCDTWSMPLSQLKGMRKWTR